MTTVKREDEIQGTIIHEYDGIEEADNDLPRWWMMIFLGSIVFSIFYWFIFEEYQMMPHPQQRFAAALAARAEQGGEVSEGLLIALADDSTAMDKGEELWTTNCVACHKAQGQGEIGPNLTDRYWIHGGSPVQIHNTIRDGVDGKGMQSWLPVLGARGVQLVSAYVLTIQNTEVPGKEPQGELWDPSAAPDAAPEGDVGQDGADALGTDGAQRTDNGDQAGTDTPTTDSGDQAAESGAADEASRSTQEDRTAQQGEGEAVL